MASLGVVRAGTLSFMEQLALLDSVRKDVETVTRERTELFVLLTARLSDENPEHTATDEKLRVSSTRRTLRTCPQGLLELVFSNQMKEQVSIDLGRTRCDAKHLNIHVLKEVES